MAGLSLNACKDPKASGSIRVAFLHVAPRHDDLAANLAVLERLILRAAELRADLVLTPELAVSGYEFYPLQGKDWIRAQVPAILAKFCALAHDCQLSLLLGCPTYDLAGDLYHNSAVLIAETGQVLGFHHKILTLPGSIEGWSVPGPGVRPLEWHGQKIGLLICADAYRLSLAEDLAHQGADMLFSLAAWAPGAHGPSGEWERCAQATGLPFYVCNRTGQSATLDFSGSSSVVAVGGRRILEYNQKEAALLTVDVDLRNWQPLQPEFRTEVL